MSEKTVKSNNIRVNKKEFYKSKQNNQFRLHKCRSNSSI